MEIIIIVAMIVFIYAYNAGKREGSRKGYGVGYSRGRRAGSGCLIVLFLGVLSLAAVARAVAAIFWR